MSYFLWFQGLVVNIVLFLWQEAYCKTLSCPSNVFHHPFAKIKGCSWVSKREIMRFLFGKNPCWIDYDLPEVHKRGSWSDFLFEARLLEAIIWTLGSSCSFMIGSLLGQELNAHHSDRLDRGILHSGLRLLDISGENSMDTRHEVKIMCSWLLTMAFAISNQTLCLSLSPYTYCTKHYINSILSCFISYFLSDRMYLIEQQFIQFQHHHFPITCGIFSVLSVCFIFITATCFS